MAIAARALEQVRRRRPVVLGYHGVAVSRRRDDLSMLLVAPDRFRVQIELLLAAGFRFVTLAELARQAAGEWLEESGDVCDGRDEQPTREREPSHGENPRL